MSLAVRHKVTLTDYELTTTLGTGKFSTSSHKHRVVRACDARQAQEDRRVLRDEATEEGGYYQVTTSGPCDL